MLLMLPHQLEAFIAIQRRFTSAAALLFIRAKILLPQVWCVFALTSMPCDACAYATDHRGIDACSRYNHLPLRECWQIIQQIATNALDSGGDALLVDLVHDRLEALRL